MTDPFANHLGDRISERFAMMVSMPPNSTPELWERLSGEVAKLESDADALLAVKEAADRLIRFMEPGMGLGNAVTVMDDLRKALAALPEHLK